MGFVNPYFVVVLDAMGKIPPGVLRGNLNWAGAYEECLAAQAPPDLSDNLTSSSFSGKYCTVSLMLKIDESMSPGSIGICVPDTCQESDFSNSTNFGLFLPEQNNMTSLINSLSKIVSVKGISCQQKHTAYSTGAIIVMTILFLILGLLTVATSVTLVKLFYPSASHYPHQQNNSVICSTENGYPDANDGYEIKGREINTSDREFIIPENHSTYMTGGIFPFLKCFCMITNGSKILDTSDKGGKELRCLHGIRFLSMAWVIVGHIYGIITQLNVVDNPLDMLQMYKKWPMLLILQGTYAVDTFFVLSGFLLTYLFLREMNVRDGKISWLSFYLHRYWRLTPVYALLLVFGATLPWYMISGPFRPPLYEDNCKTTWWWNFLYINNFLELDDMCMGWSWYLANDMQFYVISPIFLYALWKRPKVGLWLVAGLFCGSWISNFAITYHYDIFAGLPNMLQANPSAMAFYTGKMQQYRQKLYFKPYTRIGPYLIGVVMAYVLYQIKDRRNFLSKRIQVAGWLLSTGMALLMVFGLYNSHPTRIGNAFFNAFSRSCFSASIAWVIFACLTGHGGIVNKWLSHSIFIPLSRLTYCAYLTHPTIFLVYILSLPNSITWSHYQLVMFFLGLLPMTYCFSFLVSLAAEAPPMAIEKFWRNNGKTK